MDTDTITGEVTVPGGVITRRAPQVAFHVHLDNFEGPFDLLLGLIAKHKLDITEIALAQVTDEFIGHIRERRAAGQWDLSQASEFLLVAATLLDLKAARLLPQLDAEDDDDLALIEARDLLFARLLQYRAFKQVAAMLDDRMQRSAAFVPRQAGLDPQFADLLPELVMGVSPHQLAVIAARALTPKAPPSVGVEHLHAPVVSVQEQAARIATQLRQEGSASFRALIADAETTLVIVARFLALLELYREAAVAFDQPHPLGELIIRWIGPIEGEIAVSDEFDAPDGAPAADRAKDEGQEDRGDR